MTRPGKIALVLALWTIFGILSALQVYVRDVNGRSDASVFSVFNIVYYYWAWALTTPLIVRLSTRIARDERKWWIRVASGLPLAFVILATQSVIYTICFGFEIDIPPRQIFALSLDTFVRHLAGNVLTLGTIVGGFVAFRYYQTTQQKLVRAAELESSLSTARLDSLRTQLQPHFLFNTLNLISGLVAKGDAPTANRAIARLGDLLRATLDSSGEQKVPLSHELDLTRRYLEIAKLRFGDRLVVRESIADEALRVPVPTLILQPLIENALEHAIGRMEKGGTIQIDIHRRDGTLVVNVEDDGPGFSDGDATRSGVGLSNTRDRLIHLYGTAASLRTSNRPGGGALVTIELPA